MKRDVNSYRVINGATGVAIECLDVNLDVLDFVGLDHQRRPIITRATKIVVDDDHRIIRIWPARER